MTVSYLFGKQAPASVRDAVLLAARVLLGSVFIAHGWQKFTSFGIDGTAANFAGMGVPAANLAAWFAASVELVGGILLILGLLTPLAGVLIALTMGGAFWFAHRGNGILSADGGWELVGALGAGALVIAAVGAGRFSLDSLLGGRRNRDAVLATA